MSSPRHVTFETSQGDKPFQDEKIHATRVRITRLPNDISEEKLRSHFHGYGKITDLVILRSRSGNPRMAYIGYNSSIGAENSICDMNGAYIGSAKILVERAKFVDREESHMCAMTDHRASKSQKINDPRMNLRQNTEISDDEFFQHIQSSALSSHKLVVVGKEIPAGTGDDAYDRIILKNISFQTTKESLEEYLKITIGDVKSVHIPVSLDKTRSRGIAFVSFNSQEAARKALRHFQCSEFEGRLLVAELAAPNPYEAISSKDPTTKARKRTAKLNPAFNPLFMDIDAINRASAMCLKLSKADILDPEKQGVAHRTAIAESILTKDLEAGLSSEGINVSALKNKSIIDMSSTTIIIKNLHSVTPSVVGQLENLFSKFGSLKSVKAPKGHSVVIVQYQHEKDAVKAFRRLSYSIFLNFPLLLEWAPSTIHAIESKDTTSEIQKTGSKEKSKQLFEILTLFVKNVPFGCSEEKLRDTVVSQIGSGFTGVQIRSIRMIPRKGYAFVELSSTIDSVTILSKLQDSVAIDGRELHFETTKCDAKDKETISEAEQTVPLDCDAQKITVKNVPFEANVSEIRALFSAFADVSSVRIPKKIHEYATEKRNNHRGFAFVEFTTPEGAYAAMNSLRNVHLYGRHLVLEYSKTSS